MLNFVTISDSGCSVSAQECAGRNNIEHGKDVGCRMKAYNPNIDRDQPCLEKEMSDVSKPCKAKSCAVSKNKQGITII